MTNNHIAYLESLDYLCHEVVSFFFTFVVITNISIIPLRNIQTVSTAYFWKLGYQILSSKALASRTTASDTKLFYIRLKVSKATSMNIKYIILITNSLNSIKKVVDSLVYSE